jgi:hypothetical protein
MSMSMKFFDDFSVMTFLGSKVPGRFMNRYWLARANTLLESIGQLSQKRSDALLFPSFDMRLLLRLPMLPLPVLLHTRYFFDFYYSINGSGQQPTGKRTNSITLRRREHALQNPRERTQILTRLDSLETRRHRYQLCFECYFEVLQDFTRLMKAIPGQHIEIVSEQESRRFDTFHFTLSCARK